MAAVPQSRLQWGDCAEQNLEGRASIAGLPETSYFQSETSQKGLSSAPCTFGKVKLVDLWSINFSFSFLTYKTQILIHNCDLTKIILKIWDNHMLSSWQHLRHTVGT